MFGKQDWVTVTLIVLAQVGVIICYWGLTPDKSLPKLPLTYHPQVKNEEFVVAKKSPPKKHQPEHDKSLSLPKAKTTPPNVLNPASFETIKPIDNPPPKPKTLEIQVPEKLNPINPLPTDTKPKDKPLPPIPEQTPVAPKPEPQPLPPPGKVQDKISPPLPEPIPAPEQKSEIKPIPEPTPPPPGPIPDQPDSPPVVAKDNPKDYLKVKPKASPWKIKLEIVENRNRLTVTTKDKIHFEVVCDKVVLENPLGSVEATGKVDFKSNQYSGSCERLVIKWHQTQIRLEGNAKVRVHNLLQENHGDLEFHAPQFRFRLIPNED